MLICLKVKGFRCLKDVGVEFTPLTVLIGPNDSGKSSLLDCLMVMKTLADEKTARGRSTPPKGKVFQRRYDLTRASEFSGERETACEFLLLFRDPEDEKRKLQYDLTLGFRNNEVDIVKEILSAGPERIVLQIDGMIHVLLDGERKVFRAGESIRSRDLSFASTNSLPEKVLERLFPFRFFSLYSFNSEALSEPCPIEADGVPQIGIDGSGLAALLDYYLGAERDRFDAIEEDLRKFSPLVEKVLVRSAQTQLAPGVGKSIWFRLPGGVDIPAWQASDGLLFALGFLAIIHSPGSPKTMLVEEPENGIHPENLEMIMHLFRRLTEGDFGDRPVQVIMTTHSPYLLDHAEPEEVRVVTRSREAGTRVARLSDLPDLKEKLRDFKLGELWTAFGDEHIGGGARS